MNKNTKSQVDNILLAINGLFFISLFLFRIFKWDMMDRMTPFFYPLVELCVFLITISLLVVNVIFFIRNISNGKRIRKIMSGLLLICCIACWAFPLDEYSESIRFDLLSARFDNAAHFMHKNSNDTGATVLPKDYKDLSRGGGEVIIEGNDDGKVIIFFSYRGILSNMAIYAYAPNSLAYQTLCDYEDWKQIEKVRADWYYRVS